MVPSDAVAVLGQPPFHATNLTTSGALSYIGGNWERDVAFAGYSVPLAVSFTLFLMLLHNIANQNTPPNFKKHTWLAGRYPGGSNAQ